MENIPRPFSPQYIPQPLSPSPFHTRTFAPQRTATPAVLPERSGSPLYLSTVSQPKQDPNTIIHDHYNVSPVSFSLGRNESVPRTVEMPLLRVSDALPTHVLVVLSSASQSRSNKSTFSRGLDALFTPSLVSSPDAPQRRDFDPYLIPIHAESFFLNFGHDTARALGAATLTSKWSKSPSPHIRTDRTTGARFVTLPVIPLYIPHPPSLPHVLLFAQGIPLPNTPPTIGPGLSSESASPSPRRGISSSTGSSASALATYLLPLATIEEFPSAPAMAAAMAHHCTPEALAARVAFNQGVWRNVLALSPGDATLVDLVRIAWNVTSDAARLQQQQGASVPLSAPPPRAAVKLSAVASRTRAVTCDVARDAKDVCERSKVPDPSALVSPHVTGVPAGLPTPRLPVIEVDYPVDFLVKPVEGQRAIPVGESFEKRLSVQCLAPVSPLESSLRGRSSHVVQF